MDKSQTTPGVEYAIREPVAVGVEFQRVKVLERVRGAKWRVEWIDPNPRLVDFTEPRNIVVAWDERKAFLHDERNEAALQRAVEESGFPGNQHPAAQAVHTVFAATGEPGMYVWYGVLNYPVDALQRVAHRAGTSVPYASRRLHRPSRPDACRGPLRWSWPRRSRATSRPRCSI